MGMDGDVWSSDGALVAKSFVSLLSVEGVSVFLVDGESEISSVSSCPYSLVA